MLVKDVMTNNPVCCTPDKSIEEIARLMLKNDCGAIPIVKDNQVVGIITDRDIVVRCLALGKNPIEGKVSDCMTSHVVTVNKNANLEECLKKMEENQVRRMVVVDDNGLCCGIVAQADIALCGAHHKTAEVVEKISEPVK
jgi:CBS domain-containing protein